MFQGLEIFDDMPPREDQQNFMHLNLPGHAGALRMFLGKPDTTLVIGNGAVAWNVSAQTGKLFPDLMVAFDVDPDIVMARNGYGIDYMGKPPDFILEIAARTPWHDYAYSRERYAEFGVAEYWRCDFTGENRFPELLAGDELAGGKYIPIPIAVTPDGGRRGHSKELGLDLCWENGEMRWGIPGTPTRLLTYCELTAELLAVKAERQAAEARASAQADRDAAKEARIAARAARAAAAGRPRDR